MPGMYDQEALEAHFKVTNRRLDRIEAQLVLISKTAGIPYATYAESLNVPDEVAGLARGGDSLGAIKRYRELTGANIDQAPRGCRRSLKMWSSGFGRIVPSCTAWWSRLVGRSGRGIPAVEGMPRA